MLHALAELAFDGAGFLSDLVAFLGEAEQHVAIDQFEFSVFFGHGVLLRRNVAIWGQMDALCLSAILRWRANFRTATRRPDHTTER